MTHACNHVATDDDGVGHACLHAEAGHHEPGSRAALVDAVIDLAKQQHARVIQVSVPLGDAESLQRLQTRTEHMRIRAAGATALVNAELPAEPA